MVEFRWQWNHAPLQGEYYFDLRIWSQVEEAAGYEPRGVVTPLRGTQAMVDLEGVKSITEYRGETARFYWAVVVVRSPCAGCAVEVVGKWSEKRPFFYGGPPSAGETAEPGPGAPEPTESPEAKPTRSD